jgi:hypothetical protein
MLQIEKEHKRSTLLTSKKEDLVNQIMYLEHNNNVLNDTLNQQAENFKKLCEDCKMSENKELKTLQKAFDKACEESTDSSCPNEFDLYECEKCIDCPHQNELHEDTQRDINCWKQYYLQKAQKNS